MLLSVESTIYSVDNLESLDQRISRGPFTHMSPSPNGKSLALLTYSGLLWVVSTDFQRSLAEFDTTAVVGGSGDVHQVEWCGNDAVLVTWGSLAVLVGPFGDTLQCVLVHRALRMQFDTICSSEIQVLLLRVNLRRDGAGRYPYHWPGYMRLHTEGPLCVPFRPRFLTHVLTMDAVASSVSVFRPGSTSPSAILFDAWENFSRRSPKADESIRSIRPELAAAVDECVDAAAREWEPVWQKRLLNV